jgi:hypothetical protein
MSCDGQVTDEVRASSMRLACVQDVPGSNMDRDFSWFSSNLPGKFQIVRQIVSRAISSTYFSIDYSVISLPFDAI